MTWRQIYGWDCSHDFVSLVVGGIVGVLIGNAVNRKTVGFWFGLFLGPIGWIIVLLLPRKEQDNKQKQIVAAMKRPERNFDSDDYKIWLGKTYNVQQSELFDKFECLDQLFESLEEALKYADQLDREKEVSERKKEEANVKAEESGKEKEEEKTTWMLVGLVLVFLFTVFSLVID